MEPDTCNNCNYYRSYNLPIAPQPKEKRNWCSNHKSEGAMKYHDPDESCYGWAPIIEGEKFDHMKKAGLVDD